MHGCLPAPQGGGRTTTGTAIGVLLRMFLNSATLPSPGEVGALPSSLEHLDEDVGGASPKHRWVEVGGWKMWLHDGWASACLIQLVCGRA